MRSLMSPRWRVALLLAASLAFVLHFTARPTASSADLVISQVFGGGSSSGVPYRADFVEIFNRGTESVSLAGKSIQYASATGTGNFGGSSSQLAVLSGTVQPGQYFLVQLKAGTSGTPLPTPDATGTIDMSGTAGKVALVNSATSLGCNGGSTPCTSTQLALIIDLVGYGSANFYEGAPAAATTSTTAAIRQSYGCADTDNNSADFATGAPAPRNTASPVHPCTTPTPPAGVGSASPSTVLPGETTLLTVRVVPGTVPTSSGLTVVANLTGLGLAPSQAFVDDGTNGDANPGDKIFSYRATIAAGTPGGTKTASFLVSDAQGRSAGGSLVVNIPSTLAIHDIQGSTDISPYNGQPVKTWGVVTGVKTNGFFMQATGTDVDTDPTTSEGVFVYTATTPPTAATVGNQVEVLGFVEEFEGRTEIGGAPSVSLISSGNPLPSPVTVTAAYTDPAGGLDQLERFEGMRARVDSLTVVGPTGSYTAPGDVTLSDGLFYAVLPGIARPFREPGIAKDAPPISQMPAGVPVFDTNPERLWVDSDALGGAAIDVTTGAVIQNVVGPLDYASGAYGICLDTTVTPTVAGEMTAVAVPEHAPGQFTVASFNMLNFTSKNEVRMTKASLAIREMMHMPEVVGVQEVNSLATLEALAAKLNADAVPATPNYKAYLEVGNTAAQNVGFLVKASVMTVDSVEQVGKDLTFTDPRNPNVQQVLYDRPPLVLRGSVLPKAGGEPYALTVVVNHLRSLIDVDSDQPVGLFARTKRQLGAEYLANLINGYQASGEHVISLGDYNAYPFNDGYVDVVGTVLGAPTPADQVLMASADLVNPDFTRLDVGNAGQRYSYIENGNAQTIDHVLASSNMAARIVRLAYARIDADFPGIYSANATRPERVSDHDPVVAYFSFPSADLSVTATGAPSSVLSGSSVTYTVTVSNDAAYPATNVEVSDTLPTGLTVTSVTPPAGWECNTASPVRCTAATLAGGTSAAIRIVASAACLLPPGNLESAISVDAATYDPDLSNNTFSPTTEVLNPPPVIIDATATPGMLWPVNHQFVPVSVPYTTSDNCGVPVCSLGVTSSEPADARGDGRTAPDFQLLVDPHRVMLRAERSGTEHGRTYTIGISCSDGVSASRQNVFVTVPKSQGVGQGSQPSPAGKK